MTPEEIKNRLAFCEQWYHIIQLAPGIETPGLLSLIPQWAMMRQCRRRIDYAGKWVIDIGSYDGMWAFEAEQLRAAMTIATDCIHLKNYQNFLFARACLDSRVLPYYNVAPHELFERLGVVFEDAGRRFDIVQHLGVLYHLRDPMASLMQARSCLVDGGTLWMETAITREETNGMMFNGLHPEQRAYCDHTTYWIPSLQCLCEMLELALFEVDDTSIMRMAQDGPTDRVTLIAKAMPVDIANINHREGWRRSRNIGLHLDRLLIPRP